MLSIVVPVRNTRKFAGNCLKSILDTLDRTRLWEGAEVILMDDCSDAADQIPDLFRSFKQQAKCEVIAFRFKQRQHYSRACAVGFSMTQGHAILLLSHDMILTPAYLQTVLAVSALDASHGIVRGTSPYVDGYPEHQVTAPLPYRSYDDIVAFADYVRAANGLTYVEDAQLCGDSFLLRRSVMEKIGVMDGRFFGYFGDIDFGLRAQRAGFKLVCAKGAWLHHVGAGSYEDEAQKGMAPEDVAAARMATVNQAYQEFRKKWNPSLPADYRGRLELDMAKLRAAGPVEGADFQEELEIDTSEVEAI